ncbi:pleckstrin homology domain-containing family D member 1-like isoform X2 [Homalodisca vitripennis]|uniref:pleckstrin homology domain-containing family D member 1-like isoform X2 n=1 Tax=Homalodisca vitripennis TaxID=197043 RepID=UPI001EEBE5D5|nr:pleckstrin homology domain-containing family D member 1-like isoform X2 [Homalodisca vitripennis]
MEEEITKLRAEFENNSLQRNKQRSETDEHFAGLMKEKSSVLAKINDLAKEMKEATDDREEFESKTTDLTKEMRRLKDICAEADGELFSYLTEANVVQSGQRNQMIVVDEMVARNQQEVEAAELNIQESEQLQAQITKMEADLSTQQVKYTQTLADLQASYREQLEAKKKYLEDLRIRYEMEFKNKEQKKLDAMMELKEIKDNIVDHQKKRKSLQNEVKLTGNNLWKYNNLIQKLEEKLKVVAEVATVSQPVKDISSQDSRLTFKENVPLQPKLAGYPTAPGTITRKILPPQVPSLPVKRPKETQKVIFPSPGSSSSGISFDPDDMNLAKRRSFTQRPKKVIKPNVAQKNVPASSSKASTNVKKQDQSSTKKDVDSESEDAWGFNM